MATQPKSKKPRPINGNLEAVWAPGSTPLPCGHNFSRLGLTAPTATRIWICQTPDCYGKCEATSAQVSRALHLFFGKLGMTEERMDDADDPTEQGQSDDSGD